MSLSFKEVELGVSRNRCTFDVFCVFAYSVAPACLRTAEQVINQRKRAEEGYRRPSYSMELFHQWASLPPTWPTAVVHSGSLMEKQGSWKPFETHAAGLLFICGPCGSVELLPSVVITHQEYPS